MAKVSKTSDVLTIRVPKALGQRLASEARRRRRSRSEVVREILETGLAGTTSEDRKAEARRQSLLVRNRRSEREALEFIVEAADLSGWE